MAMKSTTLPGIERKLLDFVIEINDAQFNIGGCWYHLILTLQNSQSKDYGSVRVSKNGGEFVNTRKAKTDTTKQEENAPLSFFSQKKFTFRLPKGFCKNDKNHEVYLLVEAFSSPESTSAKSRKVGEGKVAIYPRPTAPKLHRHADPGEDYYNYTDIMSLLRTNSSDHMQMHCGRIRNTYSFHEVVIKPPTPVKVRSPPPRTEVLTPTPRTRDTVLTPTPRTRDTVLTPSPRRRETVLTPTPRTRGTITPTPRYATTDSVPPPSSIPTYRKPPTPESTWGEENLSNFAVPPSPPPPAYDGKKIPEAPLVDKDKSTFYTDRSYRHVADNGRQQLEVIVHGSNSLPQSEKGTVPQPFTVVKTERDEDNNKKTGVTTHVSVRPTHSPAWLEMLTLNLDDKKADNETVVVTVADCQTQKGLVDYRIPVSYLTPFHQYHLELSKPYKGIPNGVSTYASITRKLPRLPKDPSSPNYLGLEVLLRSVQRPIETPHGPLIAVARIVPDYENYKSDNLESLPRNAGVVMYNVTFPTSHPSNYIVPETDMHGHPQVSLPGRPDSQPKWNHPYLFLESRDKATLFTPCAALVIEYYVASLSMTDQFWRMQSPVAFSSILLDQEMYKNLIADRAKQGLRIEGVPLQGSDMRTMEGKRVTVGMILRLITTDTPDTMVSMSNLDDIPALDMYPPSDAPGYYRNESPDILKVSPVQPFHDKDGKSLYRGPYDERSLHRAPYDTPLPPTPDHIPPSTADSTDTYAPGYYLQRVRRKQLSPIQDGSFPSMDAMETILPEYQYIFHDGKHPGQGGKHSPRGGNPGPSTSHRPKYEADDLEKNSMVLLDHQSKEIDDYRSATKKMGGDIMALRQQVIELSNVNSNLRSTLANYKDSRNIMIESSDLEDLTKAEIWNRFANLKQTLSTQTSELKAYKTKLQEAQNELIKKNDREKEFLTVQKAHATQQAVIQKLQDRLKKMKKLEEACKQQEDMIQKMEKVIQQQQRDRANKGNKDKGGQAAQEAVYLENQRLRAQIEELKVQARISGSRGSPRDDAEKMELIQKLERADGRIQALEKQLSENARIWGKDRADMQQKLNEAEYGLGRSGAIVLHDFQSYNEPPVRRSPSYPKKIPPIY